MKIKARLSNTFILELFYESYPGRMVKLSNSSLAARRRLR